MPTLFTRIVNREIPAKIVYEDDQCLAFEDIAPKAPTHVLLIPKKEIASLDALAAEDAALLGHMMMVVQKLARDLGVADGGYRLIANTGANGGQTVDHLHFHILGGRALDWPPG
jgi:histidine triad (HIT) family protein